MGTAAYHRAVDGIEIVREVILKEKYADQAWIEEIEGKVKEIVDQSVKFAEESPWPEASELYTDVYIQEDYPYIHD